jgi:hypothetical protein
VGKGKKLTSGLEEEMFDLRKRIIMLPLKLAENQASALYKISEQAH